MSNQDANLALLEAYANKHGSIPKSHALALIEGCRRFIKAQEKPFCFGLADSDGKPYMDEYCVSLDPVALKNNSHDDLRVVALYLAPPVDAMSIPPEVLKFFNELLAARMASSDSEALANAVFSLGLATERALIGLAKQ